MPIRGHQKTIGKALVGSAVALVCAYLWMKTRETEETDEEQRDYGTVAVVVTQEVVENESMMRCIKKTRDRDVVLVVNPEVGSLGLVEDHRVLRMSQETSIYHILKQIRPHVTLVPECMYQSAVEEHRLNRFLPNVLELKAAGVMEEYVAHASYYAPTIYA